MDSSISITLLRHGLTSANERSQYIGWSNPPLSRQGRTDAELAHQKLVGQIDYVFSSDLKRCTETAEILYPTHPVQKIRNLREMHFGNWEEKTYEQLKHIAAYRNWIDNPFESGPKGGETFTTFKNRIIQAFEKIKRQMATHSLRHIAIVTHGGVVRCLLMMLVKSDHTFFDWPVPYTGGYRLHWDEKEFWRGKMCISLQAVPTTEKQHG